MPHTKGIKGLRGKRPKRLKPQTRSAPLDELNFVLSWWVFCHPLQNFQPFKFPMILWLWPCSSMAFLAVMIIRHWLFSPDICMAPFFSLFRSQLKRPFLRQAFPKQSIENSFPSYCSPFPFRIILQHQTYSSPPLSTGIHPKTPTGCPKLGRTPNLIHIRFFSLHIPMIKVNL